MCKYDRHSGAYFTVLRVWGYTTIFFSNIRLGNERVHYEVLRKKLSKKKIIDFFFQQKPLGCVPSPPFFCHCFFFRYANVDSSWPFNCDDSRSDKRKKTKKKGEANLKWYIWKKGTVMAALRLINFRQCGCAKFSKADAASCGETCLTCSTLTSYVRLIGTFRTYPFAFFLY